MSPNPNSSDTFSGHGYGGDIWEVRRMGEFQPELGQAVFGCPVSEYECPSFVEAGLSHLASEIERVKWNRTQEEFEAPIHNNGGEFKTEVFSMHAYYWGDCTCGAEEPPCTDECRKHNSDRWHSWRDGMTSACRCNVEQLDDDWLAFQIDPEKEAAYTLDNPRPANECICGACDGWEEKEECSPDCLLLRPNFKCGDFEVRWYKRMGRGMSMNSKVDANAFAAMMDKCLESVRALDAREVF